MLVSSLLRALVQLDGDALVAHAGQHPYMVTSAGPVELGTRSLPGKVVADLAEKLLSKTARTALHTSGSVQYTLPIIAELPREHFTVIAARGADPEDLAVVIHRQRLETRHTIPTPRIATEHARGSRFPALVLHIEDSIDQLDLYEIALSDRYQFLGASDAETGVKLAIAEQPDVVLVDLQMPRMSGWQVCRHLANDPRTTRIPIIILTGQDDADISYQAMRVGAADVLHKPCNVDRLRDHIASVIRHQPA
jgi:CheY-like chemotaxis protein